MSPLKRDPKRKFFDVHTISKQRNVINLRTKFRIRHPLISVIVLLAALVLLFFGVREISTRAEVQDFVPTTCLGSWQNVANAEGSPETLNASNPTFSSANSATYASGTEIYCGGFIPPSFATSGQITNVGLTLVWQVGDGTTSTPADIVSSTPDDTASSSADDLSTTATTTPIASTTVATSTDVITPSVATTTVATSTVVSPVSTDADTTTSSSSSSSDDSSNDVPVLASSTPADASATSFFRQLIPFAFAQDVATSSATSTISTSTLANATTAVALPPPVPDNNFLDVSYSTDGQTWISVGQVNINNWQNFTVTLPIADWADLENLQIRVEGIPTTQDPVPPVYLDGMFVEVHYDSAPSLDPSDTASSTIEATSSAPSSSPSARMTLVDPGAEQNCAVDPFSQELQPGGTAAFTVDLHPSINGVSYNLLLGHLPQGVSAAFGIPSGPIAATSSLVFRADASTMSGSMNIAVIYQENEENGATLSNFCQLNIDVE